MANKNQSAQKSHEHQEMAAVAGVVGLMFLAAFRLVGCFWLVLLLAFQKTEALSK